MGSIVMRLRALRGKIKAPSCAGSSILSSIISHLIAFVLSIDQDAKMLLQRSFLAIALAWTAAAASERTCYYPNGQEASGNVPCTDSMYTSCCGESAICLSNGYCMDVERQPYTMSRGACTDSSWGADCPSQCAGCELPIP